MTQNAYPPPPGGWQQPAPAGAPPGYPPADVAGYPYQQAPPVPAYGTPPPPAAPAPAGSWGDPGAGMSGDGDAPALHQLENRLIFWRPRGQVFTGTKYQSSETEDQLIVDLIVLDGPPIQANINGDTGVQTPFASGPKIAPFFVGGVRVRATILDKLRDYADSPNPAATCLARFVKTPPRSGGKPYNDLRAATSEDQALAAQVYPRWDELKAAGAPPAPAPYGQAPGAQVQPPGGYGQPPAPAGPPPGWAAQNPPGAPQQQPTYPQQAPPGYPQAGPPPGQYPPY